MPDYYVQDLESVPEPWRESYKPAPDGGFTLDVAFPQGQSPQDAQGYKSTLDRERQRTQQVVAEREQLKQQFDGYRERYRALDELEDEERQKALERIASGEPLQAPGRDRDDAGNAQAWKERLKNLGEKLGREKADLVKDYEAKLDAERQVNAELARRHAVADMVAHARPVDGAQDELRDFFASRVQVVRDPDGTPRIVVPVDGQEFEPRDWIDRLFRPTTFAKRLLDATGGGGGGAENERGGMSGGANPFSPEGFNLTEQGRLKREEPQRYEQLKHAASVNGRGAPAYQHR